MNKFIFISILSFFFISCADDWKDALQDVQSELDGVKEELINQKKILEALQKNTTITGVKQSDDHYTIQFSDGQSISLTNGKTPLITIGDNGRWFINGKDTGIRAKGEDGTNGHNGTDGSDGHSPSISIGKNGNWFIDGTDTTVKAVGVDGTNAPTIVNIVETWDKLIFYFSDKSEISCLKDRTCNLIYLFKKILFIGDSVTDGHVIDDGISKVIRELSYPSRMKQILGGIEIINKGHAGESVEGWNKNRFDSEFYPYKDDVDMVIIELGWNQKQGCTWPSSMAGFNQILKSDVISHGYDFKNYNTNNSLVGNYCQLIQKIKEVSPNAVIILVASFGWKQLRADFVSSIAKWGNVLFIDGHLNKPDAKDGVHFTALGYLEKANIMIYSINKVLSLNKEYIKKHIYSGI